ncbi:hypothetical protein JCM13210_16990 [Thermaerobacter litoralis]
MACHHWLPAGVRDQATTPAATTATATPAASRRHPCRTFPLLPHGTPPLPGTPAGISYQFHGTRKDAPGEDPATPYPVRPHRGWGGLGAPVRNPFVRRGVQPARPRLNGAEGRKGPEAAAPPAAPR